MPELFGRIIIVLVSLYHGVKAKGFRGVKGIYFIVAVAVAEAYDIWRNVKADLL